MARRKLVASFVLAVLTMQVLGLAAKAFDSTLYAAPTGMRVEGDTAACKTFEGVMECTGQIGTNFILEVTYKGRDLCPGGTYLPYKPNAYWQLDYDWGDNTAYHSITTWGKTIKKSHVYSSLGAFNMDTHISMVCATQTNTGNTRVYEAAPPVTAKISVQDTTPPTIRPIAPLSGSTTNDTTPLISFQVKDYNPVSVSIIVDDVEEKTLTGLAVEQNGIEKEVTVTYEPVEKSRSYGEHTVTIQAKDGAGSTGFATWSFTIKQDSCPTGQIGVPGIFCLPVMCAWKAPVRDVGGVVIGCQPEDIDACGSHEIVGAEGDLVYVITDCITPPVTECLTCGAVNWANNEVRWPIERVFTDPVGWVQENPVPAAATGGLGIAGVAVATNTAGAGVVAGNAIAPVAKGVGSAVKGLLKLIGVKP